MASNHKFYTNVTTSYSDVQLTGIWNGKRFIRDTVRNFQPELYVPHPNGEFTATDGMKLNRKTFEDVRVYRQFVKQYKDVSNINLYGEINPEYQFIVKNFGHNILYDKSLMNISYFDIETASLNPDYRPTHKDIFTLRNQPVVSIALYHSLQDKVIAYGLKPYDKHKSDLKGVDIEYYQVDTEYELLSMFASHITSEKYRPDLLFGWNSSDFDIPYLTYRCEVVGGKALAQNMSPFGSYNRFIRPKKTGIGVFRDMEQITISGLQHVDMLDAYKQFGGRPTRQSYALDFIAKMELERGKLDYGDCGNIFDFYHKDHQRYIDYNILDTYLLKLLDDKIGLSTRIISSAFNNKCNFTDTIGTTKQWDTRLYSAITNEGLIIPHKIEGEKVKYEGGYVRDSMLGVHHWVLTKDVTSEYPRCIIMCNMSPETLVENPEPNGDYCKSADGVYFRKDKDGIIAKAANDIFINRSEFKKDLGRAKKQLALVDEEMKRRGIKPMDRFKGLNLPDKYNPKLEQLSSLDDNTLRQLYADIVMVRDTADVDQYIMKILVNSLYGSLGNRFFRYYRPEIAEAITKTGQYIIKSFAETLNNCMNRINGTSGESYVQVDIDDPDNNQVMDEDYLVMGDTDSCAISFESYVNKHCEGWSDEDIIKEILRLDEEVIQPEIDNTINTIYKTLNVKNKGLEFGTETIAKKAVYLVKKHYLGHIVWDEGKYHLDYDDPELKVKGLEGVKSSTSLYFQEKLREFYKLAMVGNEDEVKLLVKRVYKEYRNLDSEEIGKPIKIRELDKWRPSSPNHGIYIKGTHENAKAALIYNHWLDFLDLNNKYQKIKEGDAVSLIKLTEPNLLRERVIAIPKGVIPEEFKIDECINLDEQIQKYYIKPITNILDMLGWSLTEKKGFF